MKAAVPTAIFINLDVDDAVAADPELTQKLVEACPVDIFGKETDGTLKIVDENLDECVLCYLCVNAAPEDTVRVIKLYEES